MMNKTRTQPAWSQPDLIANRIQDWSQSLAEGKVAERCRDEILRFSDRTQGIQRRLGMPLIVAFLGGTGTGKSTLINAILGETVVQEGKQRPTTAQPILVCRPGIDPAEWGIDTSDLHVEKCDLPALERAVFLDCPDPDTTENEESRLSNLARLRKVLPLCDILVVTGTQQKYRSRKVADELAEAAPGARLVFVQTHADKDVDIRNDWSEVLEELYTPGTMYLVDSHAAMNEQKAGKPLTGEFAELHRLLTCDLTDEAALGVREANYFDLAGESLRYCSDEIEKVWPHVCKLREQIIEQRNELGVLLSDRVRDELVQDRRLWENRLVSRITNLWGYSPFSIVLRTYLRLGSIAMGMVLARARSIPQLAALGAVEGVRTFRRWSNSRKMKEKIAVEDYWDEIALRESTLILSGFAQEANIAAEPMEKVLEESEKAGEAFTGVVSRELDLICERLTNKHNTLLTRILYETLLTAMLVFLLARPAYNFFYESLVYNKEIWSFNNYVVSIFWLLAWSAVLLGIFTLTLRTGLEREITETASHWGISEPMRIVFRQWDDAVDRFRSYREQLKEIREKLAILKRESEKLDRRLGRRK